MIVLPSALDRIALEHFPQQVRPSARAVHFVARHHVAWAHRAAFVATAFADSDTSLGCAGEVSIVVGKLEIRFWLPGVVICSEPEILVGLVRIDDLAGVHLVVRIPDAFEVAKRLHQFVAEHDRQ